MWAHLNAHLVRLRGVKLENQHGDRALIAIQGPKSVAMLQPHVDVDLAGDEILFLRRGQRRRRARSHRAHRLHRRGRLRAVRRRRSRAPTIWNALLRDHAADGLEPCGLGARDVLRLEAGMPLYGHELTEEITPVQAGQTWALKMNKPEFIGQDGARGATRARRLLSHRRPRDGRARSGARGLCGPSRRKARVGEVRSGSIAPSVGNKNIATALRCQRGRNPRHACSRSRFAVRRHAATVVPLPFYKRQRNIKTEDMH